MAEKIEIDRHLLLSLLVLAKVIEAHDRHSGGHVWRTSRYAGALARAAGFEAGDVFLAELGALVHDVGKVGVSDSILLKQGKITEAEFEVIRRHPEIGHAIIANHPLAPLVDRPVTEHHLRADGNGYPDRLKGTRPWIISRLVSIADAFDAMTSYHPYRRDDAVDYALLTLREERGGQFDADLADTFVDLVRQGAVDHVLDHAAEGFLNLDCPECGPMISQPAGAGEDELVVCPSFEDEFVLAFEPGAFDWEWSGEAVLPGA